MTRIKNLVKQSLKLETSTSRTILELVDGRREELEFTQERPTEFNVSDSEFSIKSGIDVEVQIQNVDLIATSKLLWPGQKIHVRGGINAQGEPIRAKAKIPVNSTITDGVEAESFLYWDIQTPDGTLRNKKPIHMKGLIKGLPPKDAVFHSQDVVPIYDENGNEAGSLYNCLQSN